ncbi:MAG: sulfite exporter TauE/SafE family protein, partial [Snowella sp.]
IGGGTILVPLIVTLGYLPKQAVATSSLAILISAAAGSVQNWRMGYFHPKKVIYLGIPASFTTQLGVFFANRFSSYLLLLGFGLVLLLNIYLLGLCQTLTKYAPEAVPISRVKATFISIATGGAAGIIAGLFGLGGGVILVPLQVLLLGETLKTAIQTSLGAIIITAFFACTGHAIVGNVLFIQGIILGLGGLLGTQISTRLLPKLPEKIVSILFRIFLSLLSGYVFWQAWQSYLAR